MLQPLSNLKHLPVVLLVLALLLPGCVSKPPVKPVSPPAAERNVPALALIPGTLACMNTPGFWIGQTSEPDRLVMDWAAIAAFNARSRQACGELVEIAAFKETVSGEKLKAELAANLNWGRGSGLWLAGGTQPAKADWKRLERNYDLDAIAADVKVRFGLVSEFCDQRALPMSAGLFRKDLNLSFDRIQLTTLDVATPVAVLHQTADGLWYYVAGPDVRGWVSAAKVAICDAEILKAYAWADKLAVVTAAKADIFLDENLTSYWGRAQMGSKLYVLEDSDPLKFCVLVPVRLADGRCEIRAAYVQKTEASLGYLPYTPRTIINQAFKLLNAPYGWGGQFGEQDCSRFIQQVFATVGLILPRNSGQQAKIGRLLYLDQARGQAAAKRALLAEQARPALTTLRMNGHIMLYLGQYEGEPYIIHDLWGYNSSKTVFNVVNRVAVTRLDLGRGESGSLLDKINTIRVLDNLPASPPPPAPTVNE
ncbi:MAG: SH3 domain of the SH3b1 type [Deltaproteobacteria bacterium ADurb.Bin510]|nr:MAG: SH3 domain of the SH3b1 type [Deltaproteobacteria bacterium ADurb.Bin510]